jgi:hypothetical protein
MYKFPALPGITSVAYEFSDRTWFQSLMHVPFSPSPLLMIKLMCKVYMYCTHHPSPHKPIITLFLRGRNSPLRGDLLQVVVFWPQLIMDNEDLTRSMIVY